MLSPIWGITTSIISFSIIARSNIAREGAGNLRRATGIPAARAVVQPSARIDVTGCVKPHGTMYRK